MKTVYLVYALLVLFSVGHACAESVSEENSKRERLIAELMKKADSGSSNAMYILAGMYLDRNGDAYDEETALKFLTQAAEAVHLKAQEGIGSIYLHPESVLKQKGFGKSRKVDARCS